MMRDLRRCAPGMPTARDFIDWLAAGGHVGVSASSLSRYYSGKDVPSESFVRAYYNVILSAAGRRDLPCLLDELLDLRNSAEAADGRRNAGLRLQIRALEGELAAIRATDAEVATPLPVPAAESQGSHWVEAGCGPVLAAVELMAVGEPLAALALLEGIAQSSEAEEVALFFECLYALGQIDLADNMVKLFLHSRPLKEVVVLSQLLRKGFPDVADQLLQMLTA